MSATWIMFNSPDMLYVISDLDGNITRKNDYFKEYTSHIKPANISDIIAYEPDADDLIDAVKRAKEKKGERVRCYLTIKQKNLAMKFIEWAIYCIGSKLFFVGIPLVDVTSRTSHEYEKLKKLLEDINFDISHELRRPVTSSASLVKMILEDDSDDKESRNELLVMLQKSISETDEVAHGLAKKAARQL